MRAAMVLFFFQAEGGIEDVAVTGVQTCALPISGRAAGAESGEEQPRGAAGGGGAGGGRRDEGRGRRAAAGGGGGGFSLGEAFGLLKQALSRLGGGDKAVSADELRETMIELKGGEAEPLEVERFPKLLRQEIGRAHV